MFECISEYGYDFFPVTHFLIPFYIYILWGGGWTAALLAFSLASAFEIFEGLLVEIFNNYVFFGELNMGTETICGITILDLGNAILGCILGAIIYDRRTTQISSQIFSKCFEELKERKERFKTCTCATFIGYIEIIKLELLP